MTIDQHQWERAGLALPFTRGRARRQLEDTELGMLHPLHRTAATRAGAHIKKIEQDVMLKLVQAHCFTADAIAYMDQWVEYSIMEMYKGLKGKATV